MFSQLFKPAKPRKGASPLMLDNKELRRELRHADQIINNMFSKLSISDKAIVAYQLRKQGVSVIDDPLRKKQRQQALNRITPKRDYTKLALIIACLIFAFGWYAATTENDLLRVELQQAVDAKQINHKNGSYHLAKATTHISTINGGQ